MELPLLVKVLLGTTKRLWWGAQACRSGLWQGRCRAVGRVAGAFLVEKWANS